MSDTVREIPSVAGSVLGNIREFATNPPLFLTRIANEYGDIAKWSFGVQTAVMVRDPELIREILVVQGKKFPKDNRDLGIMQRIAGRGLLGTMGEEHKRMRKLSQPAFHHKRIQSYADFAVDYTDRMSAEWAVDEVRDISEDMLAVTMYIISKILFDADMDDMADQVDEVGHAVDVLQTRLNQLFPQPVNLPKWFPSPANIDIWRNRGQLDQIMDEIIAERRANPVDNGDLLSMLMMTVDEDGDSLSNVELRDQLLTMFLAGHETTSNALTWTWYLLSQHPDIEAKFHEELDTVLGDRPAEFSDLRTLKYTTQIFKESMRLYPPAWTLTGRVAAEDTVVGGYSFKKGDVVFISPYIIHRNETFFEQPERFIPERFSPEFESALPKYAYMPFGGGGHVCIGQSLAMMEAIMILATLGKKFRFELDPAQKIEIFPRITMSSMYGMNMKIIERESAPVSAPPELVAAD